MTAETPWTDEAIATLRQLWAAGVSTAKIGVQLHLSKNSIVGKAKLLNLPPRPSPIRPRNGDAPKPRPRAALRGTLPPSAVIAVETVREVVPVVGQRARECCWLIGNPKEAGFRFCDSDSSPGKSYCPGHCAIAYISVPKKQAA
jgi:GcrA cell cycle regulator